MRHLDSNVAVLVDDEQPPSSEVEQGVAVVVVPQFTTAPAPATAAAPVTPGIVLAPPIGAQLHKTRFARRGFLKVVKEGAPTTTRQAEVLNTAIIGSPTDERGVVIGIDRISAAMIAHDPFTAYESKHITSPNVLLMGMLGVGKSSLIKTVYVERPLLLKDGRVVVVDKKPRDGEGEYADVTRRFWSEPYRFDPDESDRSKTTCMNILDPVILAGGGPSRQLQLLVAMACLAGTGDLDEWHHKALRTAYRATMRRFDDGAQSRSTAVLPDLID